MQITLIRHLPTDWNTMSLLQGRQDIGISPVSKSHQKRIEINKLQLEKLAPFDMVVASTLKRTYQSAKYYHYDPKKEALLNEFDFGRYEGLPKEILLKDLRGQWFKNPETIVLGESMLKLQDRITSFLEKYKRYQNILLFGHGCWIRAFLSYIQAGHINNMNDKIVLHNDPIIVNIHSIKENIQLNGRVNIQKHGKLST